jgi:hypothetical protein
MLASPLQSLRYPGGGQPANMTGIAERVEGGYVLSGLGNIIARPSRIVAFGRPGGEDHDDTSTTLTCDAVALARLEREQRSWSRVNDVAARLDPRRSLDHHQPSPFANLVVAQLLTGAEADDDRPRPVDGLEDSRQSCPLRRLNLLYVPGLHGADCRSRMVGLALLPEPRPKARNLPTRYGARDVGAQANRIRRAGPAFLVRAGVEQRAAGRFS